MTELEDQLDQDRSCIEDMNLNCSHSKSYKPPKKFKLLLGHRVLILKWCANLDHIALENKITMDHPAFPKILREIIAACISNHTKQPNSHRFTEDLISFCTYMYIIAGKTSYEVLSANLCLPTASTICMYAIYSQQNNI